MGRYRGQIDVSMSRSTIRSEGRADNRSAILLRAAKACADDHWPAGTCFETAGGPRGPRGTGYLDACALQAPNSLRAVVGRRFGAKESGRPRNARPARAQAGRRIFASTTTGMATRSLARPYAEKKRAAGWPEGHSPLRRVRRPFPPRAASGGRFLPRRPFPAKPIRRAR